MPDDTAVSEAVDALREAMLERGDDPGTVEAQLSAVKPKEENIVGNYADLQRMGAIAQTGTLPTPPGEEDIETSDLSDAFVEVAGPDEGTGSAAAGNGGEGGYDTWTKAELQAELDAAGVEYTSAETKADLIAKLEG
jgi:hypothetical protein